jgi:hypothetical protein
MLFSAITFAVIQCIIEGAVLVILMFDFCNWQRNAGNAVFQTFQAAFEATAPAFTMDI